ncbi:MAG: hypothetical protein V7637_6195, partial [Mycobacteriales bacterium]
MSSTILMVIVLVVMWLVVLVPMFVRRHEDPSEARPRERIATAVRVLARRPQTSVPTAVAAPAEPVAAPRSAAFRAEAHRRMLRRRRRTLAFLVGIAATGTAAAPTVSGWLWPVAGTGAALFAGYVIWLRQQVRRQQARWQRRTAVFSRTTPSHPAGA